MDLSAESVQSHVFSTNAAISIYSARRHIRKGFYDSRSPELLCGDLFAFNHKGLENATQLIILLQ